MLKPELTGAAVVGAGAFNPAIIHPMWLAEKDLLDASSAEAALSPSANPPCIVTPQVAAFRAGWVWVQITQQQAVFSTVYSGRETDLRDLAKGVFDLLPETPVHGLGINADVHVRLDSEDEWHAIGDLFLPKGLWEQLLPDGPWKRRPDGIRVGMRTMTIEVTRDDEAAPGILRVEVAPSVRVLPYGLYIGLNGHFNIRDDEWIGTAYTAGKVLMAQWDSTRAEESQLIDAFLKVSQ